jgi:hypothetical protein
VHFRGEGEDPYGEFEEMNDLSKDLHNKLSNGLPEGALRYIMLTMWRDRMWSTLRDIRECLPRDHGGKVFAIYNEQWRIMTWDWAHVGAVIRVLESNRTTKYIRYTELDKCFI